MKSVTLNTVTRMTGTQSPMGQYWTSEMRPGNTSNVMRKLLNAAIISCQISFTMDSRKHSPAGEEGRD